MSTGTTIQVVDRPGLPEYCPQCGYKIESSNDVGRYLVRMVPNADSVLQPSYMVQCQNCGRVLGRSVPAVVQGVAAGDVQQGGDMLKSDWATGQGVGNPNRVDHAQYADEAPEQVPVPPPPPRMVRVHTADDSINSAVPNGGVIQFDTVDTDTAGALSGVGPWDRVVIPAGQAGIYLLTAESSTIGNQGNTIGMGLTVNGTVIVSQANQYVTGPQSVAYGLRSAVVQVGNLKDGDYVQLFNTSTTAGPNAFTGTFLAMVRLG